MGVAAEPPVQIVRLNDLPFSSLLFINENVLLGAGYDFNPTLIAATNGKLYLAESTPYLILFAVGHWAYHSVLDKADDKSASASDENTSSVSRARELFKSKTVRGQDIKADADVLKTKHERLITHIRHAGPARGKITTVSTTGMDGRLVTWNLSSLESSFAKLSL